MPVSGPTSSIPEVDAPRQTARCLPGVSPQRSVQAGLATASVVGRGKEKEKKKHEKKQLVQSQKVLVMGEKNAYIRKKKWSQSNNINCVKKLKMKTKHNPKQAKTKAEINIPMHNK